MKQLGCQIATSENVIFKLLKDSKHEKFKECHSIIRAPTQYTGLVPHNKL